MAINQVELIQRAYRTELRPTPEQAETMLRWAGIARWVWNQALEERKRAWQEHGLSLTFMHSDEAKSQCKQFTRRKREPGHKFLLDVPSSLINAALLDLDRAYQHFFRRVKQGQKPGHPRFKSKQRSAPSFRLYETVKAENGPSDLLGEGEACLHIPRIGAVPLKEAGYIPTPDELKEESWQRVKKKRARAGGTKPPDEIVLQHARIIQTAYKQKAGRWFVSVLVERLKPAPLSKKTNLVAAHPGVRTLLTLRTDEGDEIRRPNPRPFETHSQRLERHQQKAAALRRKLTNQQKGSKRHTRALRHYEKVQRMVQQTHLDIVNARREAIHQATAFLIYRLRPRDVIVQEWDVRAMLEEEFRGENGDLKIPRAVIQRIHRAVTDSSMSEMIRQIQYKADWAGTRTHVPPQEEAVSKTCSRCRHVDDRFAYEPIFWCPVCGLREDRETNASKNLLYWLASLFFEAEEAA